jgi:hypothetical protein
MFGSNNIEAVERMFNTAIFSSNEFHPKNIGNSKTPRIATIETKIERYKMNLTQTNSTSGDFLNLNGIK